MSILQDLFELPKIITPYLLQPWTAAEIFLPHTRLVSWFTKSSEFRPENGIPSLQGKVILVTGGNAGLGQETVFQLVCHNPRKIYLAARSSEKAGHAIVHIQQRLQASSPKRSGSMTCPEIVLSQVDLADFDSVRAAAQEL